MRLKLGLFLGTQPLGGADPRSFALLARHAEEAGFDSVSLSDHAAQPIVDVSTYPYSATGQRPQHTDDPFYDPLLTLSHMAAATSRIRLGTAVYILPLRHPLITARQVACLDALSGGRVFLGVGTGWFAEEFAALGVDFRRRGRLTDAAIVLLRRLWTEDVVESEDELYPFGPVTVTPRPLQRPHPPILVGGESAPAMRRAATLGDGWIPVTPAVETLAEKVEHVLALRTAAGLPSDDFIVDVRCPESPSLELLDAYQRAGATTVRIAAWHLAGAASEHDCTLDDVLAGIEQFSERVLSALASPERVIPRKQG